MGFASSPATRQALAPYGIRVGGYRWRWGLGLKGGTFPPHYDQNNQFASDAGDFDAAPGEDVNGDTCNCNLVPVYRDAGGRFAKPGLEPIFQAPVTASAVEVYRPEPLDLTPLYDLLTQERNMAVSIPDGAIVVNIPPSPMNLPPEFIVNPAKVEISSPVVNVPAPVVNVAPPVVNVAAPEVTVNLPAEQDKPVRTSTYFAGVAGKVVIPKGQSIVSISAVCTDRDGTVKIGSNPAIIVPADHTWTDEMDDDPMNVSAVVFKNTVAYSVRTI